MTLLQENVSKEKVYVFQVNENLLPLLQKTKSIIDNSRKTNNLKLEAHEETYEIKNHESNFLLSDPELEPLNSWFQECINFAIKDLGLEKEELEITRCWGNIFDDLNFSKRHTDKNSLISGIFILSDSKNKKIFLSYSRSVWYKMILNHSGNRNWYPDLFPGQLILFPSSVPHGSTPGEKSNSLYTISFNTFLKSVPKQNLNYKETENSI